MYYKNKRIGYPKKIKNQLYLFLIPIIIKNVVTLVTT